MLTSIRLAGRQLAGLQTLDGVALSRGLPGFFCIGSRFLHWESSHQQTPPARFILSISKLDCLPPGYGVLGARDEAIVSAFREGEVAD